MHQFHMMNGKLNQNGKIYMREKEREVEKVNDFLIWTACVKKMIPKCCFLKLVEFCVYRQR